MESKPRLGIDFGTTYCCVGVWIEGGVSIIPNSIGERTTPSVVIFDSPNEIFVGEDTLYHILKKDSVKIYEIKRIIGKKYNQIGDLLKDFTYKIEQDDNGEPIIRINQEKTYYPEEIAHLIINKLIKNAELYLNQKVNEIVITVPSDFSDIQRNKIKKAAELNKDIKVLQLINEPSAAVLSYGFPKRFLKNMFNYFNPFNQKYTLLDYQPQKILHPMEEEGEENNLDINDPFKFSVRSSFLNQDKDKNILVFDLGGGTFDVSLIIITSYIFETKRTLGNQRLGGGDFDNKLMEFCLDEFSHKNIISKDEIKKNKKCIQMLKIACEKTKKILSIKEEDKVYIEDFYNGLTLNCSITRSKFENLCKEYFNQLIPTIKNVLIYKNKTIKINEIVLAGGSSKIPKVKEILRNEFPEPIKINDSISSDEVVAFGATFFSESLRRNTGEIWGDFQYLDCLQHSYGVELEDGTMDVLLKAGKKYPTEVVKYYFNAYDDQSNFEIKVYEGEKKQVNENELVGQFTLNNIPIKKKNEVCLTIIFNFDEDQILSVTASVAENGEKKCIKINKKNQDENRNAIQGNIGLINNGLNKQEKQLKKEIMDYTKHFKNAKSDKIKFDIIINYNKLIIEYLIFLETNYNDIESEKYFFLLDKLFKSYSYLLKTQLISFVDLNSKGNIKDTVESYLEKISKKNPFRLKNLLEHFKDIKKDNSDIYYSSSIYSMGILKKRGDDYFTKMNKNSVLIAKTFYEECVIIGKVVFSNNTIMLEQIDIGLRRNYAECIEECENKIKIISADFISVIENTKLTGNLFSNNNNLDDDHLNLFILNLKESLKILDSIEDLNENIEALESKSICLANIVQIQFQLKAKDNIKYKDLQEMYNYSKQSIDIANNLGQNCKTKNWYNEINNLNIKIKDKLENSSAPPIFDIKKFDDELRNLSLNDEEFLKHILTKCPFEGCKFSENMLEEYQKDKENFLKMLLLKYKKSGNEENNMINEKNKIIVKYLNNILNNLSD